MTSPGTADRTDPTAHLLPGVRATRVPTSRLVTGVLEVEGRTGAPLLFVHGNVSSGLFWQETMLAAPQGFRPLALDLRGFGATDPEPVDATRGVGDWADDVVALVEALDLGAVHLVGWSLGGGVALQVLVDRPDLVTSLTLVDPVSPFGFGGTHGPDGRLNSPDGAGSGGGCANPEFVQRLTDGDVTADTPVSPRTVLLAHYVKPPFAPDLADAYVASMLSTRTGDDHYPGTSTTSEAWPGVAPGDRGVLNTLSPKHFRIESLADVDPKPPVLWIRGADDVIVGDESLYDLATLGRLGVVPGWPGEDVCPPQPMLAQTRAVLDGYAAAGGRYREVVVDDAGHGPHLDQPAVFGAALAEHLAGAGR